MTGSEAVMIAFASLRESTDTATNAECIELLAPAGQQLVCIALMPYVKYDMIVRRGKHAMDRNRQFNYTEIGCQVTAVFGNPINQKVSDLIC